jgi:redox-sensing transcriptional repressor
MGALMVDKKISDAVIKRLPRYFRYLADLKTNGITRISSKDLSEKMSLTASQIRQDLSCFGGFGQQGYGYNVEHLHDEIGKILGVNKGFNMIIVGAGNMGQALANYSNFTKRGFRIRGIFDIRPELLGKKIKGVEIMHTDMLEEFVKANDIDIAVLAIPINDTRDMAERVIKLGVKGLWNFSAVDLKVPQKMVVENVHLSDSLMVLGYKINNNRLGG